MSNEQEVFEIADKTIKRITMLMAKLDTQNANEVSFEEETSTLLIPADAKDRLVVVALLASTRALMAIASAMKHNTPLDEGELQDYTLEFFNILCGNIVAAINDTFNISMSFATPTLIVGEYNDTSIPPRIKKELLYETGHGPVALQFFYDPPLFGLGKNQQRKKEINV